jgi:hypothetical protein
MAKIYLVVFLLLGFGIKLHGQDSDADLFDLSLEELMNIDIVSASKKGGKLVFVTPFINSCNLRRDNCIGGHHCRRGLAARARDAGTGSKQREF